MSDATHTPFKVGDYVIYRQSGIYQITDLTPARFHSETETLYYVLCSIRNRKTSVFVPADPDSAKACLRRPLDKAQVEDLIRRADKLSCDWIKNTKARGDAYEKQIKSGDAEAIFGVYLSLKRYRDQLAAEKKKFYASDEKLLEIAEHLISEEFSFALGQDKTEVLKLLETL